MAEGKIYGEPIECEAPELIDVSIAEEKLYLHFAHASDGLNLCGKHLSAMKLIIDGQSIKSWKALVEGNIVTLTANSIQKNVAIRLEYAFEGYCEVNLYNSEGLPAKPFVWEMSGK